MKSRGPISTEAAAAVVRVLRDRRGGTAMEYGLILSLVVIFMLVALSQLAGTTVGIWNNINTKVTAAR